MTDDAVGDADGDRLLDLVGVALALTVLAGVGVGVFAAATAQPGPPPGTPTANWTLDRVNVTHVAVVHAGGDPVETADLVVTVEGNERRVRWVTNGSETPVLVAGDRGVVRARAGRTVRLYWTAPSGKQVRLASWRPAR